MGGSNKAQKRQNAQTSRENAARQKEIDKNNLEAEKAFRTAEYDSLLAEARGGGRRAAESEVTDRRAAGIEKYTKMKTDYNNQERRRLFEAKKGQGQVGAGDTAITADMMKEANTFLSRSVKDWDTERTAAGDAAYTAAEAAFLKENGQVGDYVGRGKLSSATIQRGRDYHAGGGSRKPTRDSLFHGNNSAFKDGKYTLGDDMQKINKSRPTGNNLFYRNR